MDEAANHYLRAIELGDKRLQIIRRAIDLLYEAGRRTEVTQLWNQLPTATFWVATNSRLLPRCYATVITSVRSTWPGRQKRPTLRDFREWLGLVKVLVSSPSTRLRLRLSFEVPSRLIARILSDG